MKKTLATFLLASFAVTLAPISGGAQMTPKPKTAAVQINPVQTAATGAGRKRALLIGVSKYNKNRGMDNLSNATDWWDLNTEYDIELLTATLTSRKFGFDKKNILTLNTPQETTKKSILDELTKFTNETQPGDIVYIHYSGHGQPVPDKNGDEIDGMDETLVPSDYKSKKDGSNNVSDDEMGVILDALKAKKPANVTISFDSCYSGSGLRGADGTEGDMVARGDEYKADGKQPQSRGGGEGATGLVERGQPVPAGYVFLAASSQTQTAKETVSDDERKAKVGAFTYALVKALNSDSTTTYRDVYEQVNSVISARNIQQTPQIEGVADQKIFAGEILPPERYIGVSVENVTDKKSGKTSERVMLNAGSLQGMTKGSKFEIYPAGTRERDASGKLALATATIDRIYPTKAALKFEKADELKNFKFEKDDLGKARTARGFEILHNYDSVLRVAVEPNISDVKGGAVLLADVKKDDLAATVNRADQNYNVLIRQPLTEVKDGAAVSQIEKDCRGVVLQRPDGTLIPVAEKDKKPVYCAVEGDQMKDQVRAALERESRVFLVKSLGENQTTGDSTLGVKLTLLPVIVMEFNEDENPTKVSPKTGGLNLTRGGEITMQDEDYIMLEIENNSAADVYVTVLNLTAAGRILPAFPHPLVKFDNLLKKGEKKQIPLPYVFKIGEPYGNESFRMIATREPTDFTALFDTQELKGMRGGEAAERGSNAARSPLGKLLSKAKDGKRGDFVGAVASYTTSSVSFTVVPKQ